MSVQPNQTFSTTKPEVVFAPSNRAPALPEQTQEANARSTELSLIYEFQAVSAASPSADKLLRGVAQIICEQTETLGMWVSQRDEAGSFEHIHSMVDRHDADMWETITPVARPMLSSAAESKKIQVASLRDSPDHQIVVAPVLCASETKIVFGGCFNVTQSTAVRQQWLMGIASQTIAAWFSQQATRQTEERFQSLNDVFGISSELNKATDLDSLAQILVDQIQRVLNCEQVAFCYNPRGSRPTLMAVSGLDSIDTTSEAAQTTLAAAAQAMNVQSIIAFPDSTGTANSAELLPLEAYSAVNGTGACVSIPLETSDGRILGAILLAIAPDLVTRSEYLEYLQRLSSSLSNHLDVVLKANRSLIGIALHFFNGMIRGRIARITAVIALLAVVTMMIPIPYRVPCQCNVQPVLRRFVAAPHGGILSKTIAKDGDFVQPNEILAELDGRQLRIELAAISAEHQGALKKQSSAQAESDYALAQIAKSEVKRLRAELDLINDKLANLSVRSPIKGMVVAGDLEKAEGAPLEMGQTMFEIAPLDSMVAEIAIPEHEIPYINVGMNVAIKLNAFPYKTWNGTIKKIHTRAEILDSESVFIAEVRLDNAELKLKPGMKGSAKIQGESYPIGWNYFHRAAEKIRYWTIW